MMRRLITSAVDGRGILTSQQKPRPTAVALSVRAHCQPKPCLCQPAPRPLLHFSSLPRSSLDTDQFVYSLEMPKEATKTSKRKAAADKEKAPRAKAKKDKNAPKRALSAYMFFSQDWRERVKAENPDASFGEIGKLLGTKWKELDDEEKKPYIEQAARDKERAEQQKKDYDNKKADSGSGDGDDDDDE